LIKERRDTRKLNVRIKNIETTKFFFNVLLPYNGPAPEIHSASPKGMKLHHLKETEGKLKKYNNYNEVNRLADLQVVSHIALQNHSS
jgi:hypothetical protein